MRIPLVLTLAGVVIGAVTILVIGRLLVAPDRPLIASAGFSHEVISPNADGVDDVAIFSYEVTKNATISLTLEGASGSMFAFRENELRTPQQYSVAFSGVVDGFALPDDPVSDQQVIRRLIPDDTYTWRLTAVATDSGEQTEQTGQLVIRDGDAPLPWISEFSVYPTIFTPNQDGIQDRTQVNVFLDKESELSVFLLPDEGAPIYLTEWLEEDLPGERGRHRYDYEGGVDNNANPPPDGTYTVVAQTRDAVGQEIQRSTELTILDGGKPFAEIVPQRIGVTVVFEARRWEDRFFTDRFASGDLIDPPTDPDSLARTTITLPVGDLLVFMLTVENYSDVPIRTTGPEPGTVYEWTQRSATFGMTEEPGAWRVGIDCATAPTDYPWRWALGNDETLDVVVDPENPDVTYRYLAPGARATVWGAVRMTELEVRNPQSCWAGLIHEEVEVSQVNSNVGAREIRLVEADVADN